MRLLTDGFKHAFGKYRDKPAVSFFRGADIETRLRFFDLDRDSNKLANRFTADNLKKGDHIGLLLDKSLFFIVAHLAVQKIGAVTIPLNPGFKHAELQYLLKDSALDLILVDKRKMQTISDIDPQLKTISVDTDLCYADIDFCNSDCDRPPSVDIQPHDPALIIYTSGTTGNPKGAVLTHNNLVHNGRRIIDCWAISAADVLCHALPLFHVHGLCFALHTALMAGAHILMLDKFDPETVLQVLKQQDQTFTCSVFMAVPAMYNRIMQVLGHQRAYSLDHIRLWASGSAPLLVKDFRKMTEVFGKEPLEREGMTETGMNFSNPLKGKRKPGSIGVALPDLAVRIVDPQTRADVAAGETGELWLQSPSIPHSAPFF